MGFHDLNIYWSPSLPPSELESTLRFAKSLGYDVIALNHTISGTSILPNPAPISNPIPILPFYPPGHPKFSPQQPKKTSSPSPLDKDSKNFPIVLRRATLLIADPSTTNYRLPEHSRSYDLLALRPTSQKSFAWACTSTTDPPALISLDLTTSLGFHIHHKTAMSAVARGSRFEICYSQAISASGPDASRQRSNFIGNVQSLIRATKGRGIIISSEAKTALGLRAPLDVVNLLAVWGLPQGQGTKGLGEEPKSVIANEGVRRRGFRGVVDIVKPAEGGPPPRKEDDENADKKKDKQQRQGQKRKNEGGIGGEKLSTGGAGEGQMSKRQAKKLKKEGAIGLDI